MGQKDKARRGQKIRRYVGNGTFEMGNLKSKGLSGKSREYELRTKAMHE
jgi:hypothetical protein